MSGFWSFIFFKRVNKGELKVANINYERSCYIVLSLKSQKGLELVSNLQHWAKNMLEMLVLRYTSIWQNFILIVIRIKKNKQKCNFNYAAMSMMKAQILKFVDFTKTQKSRYLENKTFFLQIKIH